MNRQRVLWLVAVCVFGAEPAYGQPSGQRALHAENAYMVVRAYTDASKLTRVKTWNDKTFFYGATGLSFTGRKTRAGWIWSDGAGKRIKVQSDAVGKTGQSLAAWAPRTAQFITVDITLLGRRTNRAHAHQRPPSKPGVRSRPDERTRHLTDATVATSANTSSNSAYALEPTGGVEGDESIVGILDGSIDGVSGGRGVVHRGQGPTDRPGSEKGRSGHGSATGHVHGKTREQGGVRDNDDFGGQAYGAEHGAVGGTGERDDDGVASGGSFEVWGVVIGGIINVPTSLKSAVDVGTILGQEASPGALFKKFRGLVAGKMAHEVRTEMASAMRAEVRARMARVRAEVSADKTLSAAEKKQLLARTQHEVSQEYFRRVEAGARARIKELEDALASRSGERSKVVEHNRQTLKDHLAKAKTVEEAATVKPIRGRLPTGHKYAGGQLPLPGRLHAKYGTHIPFTDDGFPDLSRFVRKKVTIKVSGNRRLDNKAANTAAGLEETPDTWIWHHHQDAISMLLVPKELHKVIGHYGGVSIHKATSGIR